MNLMSSSLPDRKPESLDTRWVSGKPGMIARPRIWQRIPTNCDAQMSVASGECIPKSPVNLSASGGEICSADIEVHSCHGENTIIDHAVAIPAGTVQGIVFGSSHDERPVTVGEISFKNPS